MNQTSKKHLTVKQVAAILGFSTKWVYQRVQAGDFVGAWKVGNAVRIPEPAIDDWIARNNELVRLGVPNRTTANPISNGHTRAKEVRR